MLGRQGANRVRQALFDLGLIERKELVRAILMLDTSLKETIGDHWLDRSTGAELPFDIHSVISGELAPDENGVLRKRRS